MVQMRRISSGLVRTHQFARRHLRGFTSRREARLARNAPTAHNSRWERPPGRARISGKGVEGLHGMAEVL